MPLLNGYLSNANLTINLFLRVRLFCPHNSWIVYYNSWKRQVARISSLPFSQELCTLINESRDFLPVMKCKCMHLMQNKGNCIQEYYCLIEGISRFLVENGTECMSWMKTIFDCMYVSLLTVKYYFTKIIQQYYWVLPFEQIKNYIINENFWYIFTLYKMYWDCLRLYHTCIKHNKEVVVLESSVDWFVHIMPAKR